MTLSAMLSDETTTIQAIRAHLDALSGEERLSACMQLGKAAQKRLFELAGQNEACTLDDLVPPSVPDGAPVVHQGKNTLPMFTRFQKPMMRPPGDRGELYGYNEGITRALIGPGYFVAHSTADHPEWAARGAIVVNYFKIPPEDVALPDDWPGVKPNTSGLQTFVYNGTRDFMRKISEGVTIGEAYRGEESMNSWFVLVREDAHG